MKARKVRLGVLGVSMLCCSWAVAETVTVDIHTLTSERSHREMGQKLGTVILEDSDQGLILKSQLTGLIPGQHGFHVHEKGDCGGEEKDGKWVAGVAAGGHYDPEKTQQHLGPNGKGHRGDLPYLTANSDGISQETLFAPRLTVSEIRGRALVIHQGADNYADTPEPLGGGGARVACGVIPG